MTAGCAVEMELGDDAIERIAGRVAEILGQPQLSTSGPDDWLDSRAAADYLAVPRSTLHKLTSARSIPFEQSGPGARLYFKRVDLDRWRREGQRR